MSHALVRLITELVLPPLGPFVLLMLACAVLPRRRAAGRALSLLAVAWLLVFSLPGTYRWLKSPWPELPVRIGPPYPPAEAIVVLGGGRYLGAPEYGGDTAGPSTLERLRYAAKLHRETGAPLLVTGGKQGGFGDEPEGTIMQRVLQEDYGIAPRWVEAAARDTRENAALSAPLLAADGIRRVYLVTHEFHMARARAEFEQHGVTVVPMATGFERPDADSIHLWIPSFYGLSLCRHWLHEKLAPLKPF